MASDVPTGLGDMPGTLTRLRGTLDVVRALPRQRRIPFLPPEEVARLRDERVRELVRFAAACVPHYRELFRDEGIDPREIASSADLERLPLLEKATVQRNPERFRPEGALGRDALVFRTAGSTGVPVTVYRDRRSALENIAHCERERVVETRFCGRRYGYSAVAIIPLEGNHARVREFYGKSSFRPFRPRHYSLSIGDPPSVHAAALERFRPRVFRGFGSSLELLYRTAAARGWTLFRPEVIVYSGDAMTPAGRRLIEDEFGIPVLSRYTAAEAFRIGFTCQERDGFHLHEDLCVVSIVDPDGVRQPMGRRGEIVVSDLVNHGMVLLNYRLGDLGRLGPGGCACGRTSRLLTDLEGRVDSIMTLSDGSTLHPRLLEQIVQRPEVLRFRLTQHAPDRFELLLVTPDESSYERIVPDVVERLSARLAGAVVKAERRDELLASDGGKFRPFERAAEQLTVPS